MERIMKYIARTFRMSALHRSAAFEERGITGVQINYIMHISRCPGLSQDELAERLYVHKSSVTRQVAQLVKNGFVRREKDHEDKRRRLLYPTDKALALLPEIRSFSDCWNRQLTEGLSEEEKAELIRLLRHVTGQAAEHMKEHNLGGLLGLSEES